MRSGAKKRSKGCITLTVIDIFSGFLGAGKTTLIKKLISQAFRGQRLVLIENEFGEIGIDGAFLREAGSQAADLQITEMNSGCICCSLVGDFASALDTDSGWDRLPSKYYDDSRLWHF